MIIKYVQKKEMYDMDGLCTKKLKKKAIQPIDTDSDINGNVTRPIPYPSSIYTDEERRERTTMTEGLPRNPSRPRSRAKP